MSDSNLSRRVLTGPFRDLEVTYATSDVTIKTHCEDDL